MFSIDALRNRLDVNYENAVGQYQHIARNMDVFSADDMHLFNEASRQLAVVNWAANQDVVLTHNLVKAILNEIR